MIQTLVGCTLLCVCVCVGMSVDPAGGVFGAVSLVAALASIVISLTHIYLHLANFNERTQQLYIVRILIIVPAYGMKGTRPVATLPAASLVPHAVVVVWLCGFPASPTQSNTAVGSLLSLHFPDQVSVAPTHSPEPTCDSLTLLLLVLCPCLQELIFDTVRDCYEAYVVYCFLALVLSYCGGDSACVQHLCEKVCVSVLPLGSRVLLQR